jgi:PadR family transcriptional regulator PadR
MYGIESFENLRLELRRGCLVLAVLGALGDEQCGYTLRKSLAEHGLAIDEGTLYPLLRRLESQGLLASEWREHDKRNKRFYRLTPEGTQVLEQLIGEWRAIDSSIQGILEKQGAGHGTDRALFAGGSILAAEGTESRHHRGVVGGSARADRGAGERPRAQADGG